jgi:hypothetical protein
VFLLGQDGGEVAILVRPSGAGFRKDPKGPGRTTADVDLAPFLAGKGQVGVVLSGEGRRGSGIRDPNTLELQ